MQSVNRCLLVCISLVSVTGNQGTGAKYISRKLAFCPYLVVCGSIGMSMGFALCM